MLRRFVQDWWYGRAIPMTREGYDEIRNVLGDKSPMTLVEESMGLSLSDQFWVDFGGEETSWDDVNFFDNDWDGQLGVSDAEARLTEMLVFDYVLGNRDRHWNNFGFVYDARTMRPLRIAPIYDNGSSLWSDVLELSSPWYRYDPRPLMDAHMRRLWPEDQLRIFKDCSWFRPEDLAAIPEIVRNYLSMDPLSTRGVSTA